MTPDLVKRLPASQIAGRVGKALGGSGGGKPDLAQAGGKNAALLPGGLEGGGRRRAGPARGARTDGLSGAALVRCVTVPEGVTF